MIQKIKKPPQGRTLGRPKKEYNSILKENGGKVKMKGNRLRIIQLSFAINQSEQDRFGCEIHIYKNGDMTLKVDEYTELHSVSQESGYGKTYQSNQLICCRLSGKANDRIADNVVKDLENICQSIGIDTSERYIKVKVC